jgi:hypothetical protein
MTREEAIKLIGHIGIAFVPTDQYGDYADPEPYEEALNMAIKALSSDMKRQLRESISAEVVHGEWEDKEVFNETNDDHFVDEWQSARCSVCGRYHTTPYMYYFDDFNFCPNCGADMRPDK